MAQHNNPDVHVYEIDYVDADGRPRRKRLQGVRGARDVDSMLDFLRRRPQLFNDDRGRKPRSVDGASLRKLEAPDAAAAVAARPDLPPGLEKNVKAETGLAKGETPAAEPPPAAPVTPTPPAAAESTAPAMAPSPPPTDGPANG